MINVSNEYAENMKAPLRPRGYMQVLFGLINKDATSTAVLNKTDSSPVLTRTENFNAIKKNDIEHYSDISFNNIPINGSSTFYSDYRYQNKDGLVFDVDNGTATYWELVYDFKKTELRDISVKFNDNYFPVKVSIQFCLNKQVVAEEIVNNNENSFVEVSAPNTVVCNKLRIKLYAQNNNGRYRVEQIQFGKGVVFTNEDIINSTLEEYVSPIGEDIPQTNFSVTVKNYDNRFNIDNPESDANFIEQGQALQVSYGLENNAGDIEWLDKGTYYVSEWENENYQCTIRAVDILRNADETYIDGHYRPAQYSTKYTYDTVIEDLAQKGGFSDNIVNYEKGYSSTYLYPVPVVKVREGLQLIANYMTSTIRFKQDKIDFIDDNVTVNVVGDIAGGASDLVSKSYLVDQDKDKVSYLSNFNIPIDGSFTFYNDTGVNKNVPYQSRVWSDETGNIDHEMTIQLKGLTANPHVYGLYIRFSDDISCNPSYFYIYTNSENSKTIECRGNKREWFINIEDSNFTEIYVMFQTMPQAYQGVSIDYIAVTNTPVLSIDKNDVLGSIKATKVDKVKDITVNYYQSSIDKEKSENRFTYEKEGIQYFTFSNCYMSITGPTRTVYPDGVGVYSVQFIPVSEPTEGDELVFTGNEVIFKQRQVTSTVSGKGESIVWDNPLLSTATQAKNVLNMLKKYYSESVYYQFEYRGNPELEAGDVIYIDNDFIKYSKMKIERHTITFNGGFSGKIEGRRIS